MIEMEVIIGVAVVAFFAVIIFIAITLLPAIKTYIEKKADQKPIIKNEYKMMGYPNGQGQQSQAQAPDVNVYVNLDENKGEKEAKKPEIDQEKRDEQLLRKLEDKKLTFIPYSDRKDINVDFDNFGKEHVVKDN